MPAKVQAQGRYELFETTKQHRILVLNHRQVIRRLEGLNAEDLQAVRSYERAHKQRKTLLGQPDRRPKQTRRS